MSLEQVLSAYKSASRSEQEKGRAFEQLMQRFLQSYPLYENELKNVWLWDEFPFRKDLGGKDLGIDLVAETYDGQYWAIQCKFYDDTSSISLTHISHFIANAGRQFQNERGETTGFSLCLWIDTKTHFNKNANTLIQNQKIPFKRLGYLELLNAPVDWDKLAAGKSGKTVQTVKKTPRPHQQQAIQNAATYFKTHDRGKLIMACGTGKTYTALRIMEEQTQKNGFALFLVPSIALLSQTLQDWMNDTTGTIYPVCICSDAKSSKLANEDDMSVVDLPYPATTNVTQAVNQLRTRFRQQQQYGGMVVIFSTYQSIQVVHDVQKQLNTTRVSNEKPYNFDIIVCDEAHRTTGVTLKGKGESAFVKVHDNAFLPAAHRLYMTATPRLFTEDAKKKALQGYAVLCSMDDESLYGEEIYRIGFGEAVERGLLSDYKVLVLTIGEDQIPPALQESIASSSTEINTDSAAKLIGCINALSKRMIGDSSHLKEVDPNFMHTALAFCQSIKASKAITNIFKTYAQEYYDSLTPEQREETVQIDADHVDGSMGSLLRQEKLNWLTETTHSAKDCHILTNVRCLSEGIDVPALDSIIFLSSRNSQVDVVQSVGRVMRTAPGKKYGYIIIPVVVPANVEPETALEKSKDFSIIWSVLNALRAHDDRFNATVNKIELNKKKPDNIVIGGVPRDDEEDGGSGDGSNGEGTPYQTTLYFSDLQGAIYARMVKKVGTRRYWEYWAKEVADIARRHKERIERLIATNDKHAKAFDEFIAGLRQNINPSITKETAMEMLSQHLITQPVFEALFENYDFVRNNPISKAMTDILDLLNEQAMEKDQESLARFYADVKRRCEGIDNAEGKQKIILELYEKFFKVALPKTVKQLGIVYTPVEVVDFILRSVEGVLVKEFRRHLTDENIHILDPFTGTGTFITRLLQLGLIKPTDLVRKYTQELHANEIVLLAYYIASINIENAFHDIASHDHYMPFNGICLTDTFQLNEIPPHEAYAEFISDGTFRQNSERVEEQKRTALRVIIGNPPYSVGQRSANDNAQNQSYPNLKKRIEDTYTKFSKATNKNAVYDSYIKAFRWASDRIDAERGGIIAFVSNAGWLDGAAMSGMRYCLEQEFSSIYIFNLRGNARTSGEQRRKEKDNVFGQGSRTPVAITVLVKNPNAKNQKADIFYHDIGDYLTREEKLKIIADMESCVSRKFPITVLKPDKNHDWLNQRNDVFSSYIPLGDKANKDNPNTVFTPIYSCGSQSNMDSWVYNFSLNHLISNTRKMSIHYNEQLDAYMQHNNLNKINTHPTYLKWTSSLFPKLKKNLKSEYNEHLIRESIYRPFCKEYLYFDQFFIHRPYLLPKLFPSQQQYNLLLCVSGIGSEKELSVFIVNTLPDVQLLSNGQCFPLYYYDTVNTAAPSLFDDEYTYTQHSGITDFALEQAQERYGKKVTREDIFFYVYGFLHLPQYKKQFAADLKKSLPRIFFVEEPKIFRKLVHAGRDLADLHLHYETQAAPAEVRVEGDCGNYVVNKMRFPQKGQRNTIIYNQDITITHIPSAVYDYQVNGRSPVEWIMERYQFSIDKNSGIKNDPNDWGWEHENPRYVLDLLLSVMTVSLKTQEIICLLPEVKFE